MKYIVLIIDGASGWPLKEHGSKTSLELARTPHLDALAAAGELGLAATVYVAFRLRPPCLLRRAGRYRGQEYGHTSRR